MKKITIISLMAAFVLSIAFGSIAYAQSTLGIATLSTESSSCMLTMVEKRETAIILAHEMFSRSTKESLTKRRDALLTAWGIENDKERRVARLAAWNVFKKEQKEARRTHLTSVKLAWAQYKKDAKVCKTDVTNVEPEGVDITVSAAASTSADRQ